MIKRKQDIAVFGIGDTEATRCRGFVSCNIAPKAYLKRLSERHKPKKSKVFSQQNVETFLNDAPDKEFLATKITDMPIVYKTREGARKRVPIDEGKLRSAVGDVIAGASIRGTAKGYGLAVMTLKRYVRKRKGTTTTDEIDYTPNYRHSQIFSTMEESELVNYLMMANKLYHGLTPKNVRQLAFQYAIENKKEVSLKWSENEEATYDLCTEFIVETKRTFSSLKFSNETKFRIRCYSYELSTTNCQVKSFNLMAELHVLGQLNCACDFKETSSLFCRYSFQAGPNWTVISGCSEGQTVTGKPDYRKQVVWAQPLDIHYITKGLQGWPKLVLQVSCLDSIGRAWIVGYSCCSLPVVPGHHVLDVPCWLPSATTLTDRIREYFLGGSLQLLNTDIINLGTDRFKLKTQSKGSIKLSIDIILRNFSQFGVEYK
ncbi:hypothetical protein evm_005754 [Chilo suppressalis]|nr:hypothetical protein evm_005754 [Chilo suppressalis]